MDFYVRKAKIEDAYNVGIVLTHSWQSAYKGIIPKEYLDNLSVEKKSEQFKNGMQEFKGIYFYVAVIGNRIIGFLTLQKGRDIDKQNCGEIGAIYLIPDYWDKGLGKKFMDSAISELKKMNFSSIFLWVLEDNLRARLFYEKYGFLFDGAKKERNIGNSPLVEMRYVLNIKI